MRGENDDRECLDQKHTSLMRLIYRCLGSPYVMWCWSSTHASGVQPTLHDNKCTGILALVPIARTFRLVSDFVTQWNTTARLMKSGAPLAMFKGLYSL